MSSHRNCPPYFAITISGNIKRWLHEWTMWCLPYVRHNCDVIWVSWRLESQATRLFVQHVFYDNNNETWKYRISLSQRARIGEGASTSWRLYVFPYVKNIYTLWSPFSAIRCKWNGQPCSHQYLTATMTRMGRCYTFNPGNNGDVLTVEQQGRNTKILVVEIFPRGRQGHCNDGIMSALNHRHLHCLQNCWFRRRSK